MPRNSAYASPEQCLRAHLRESQDGWRLSHIYFSFLMAGGRSDLFKGANKILQRRQGYFVQTGVFKHYFVQTGVFKHYLRLHQVGQHNLKGSMG